MGACSVGGVVLYAFDVGMSVSDIQQREATGGWLPEGMILLPKIGYFVKSIMFSKLSSRWVDSLSDPLHLWMRRLYFVVAINNHLQHLIPCNHSPSLALMRNDVVAHSLMLSLSLQFCLSSFNQPCVAIVLR